MLEDLRCHLCRVLANRSAHRFIVWGTIGCDWTVTELPRYHSTRGELLSAETGSSPFSWLVSAKVERSLHSVRVTCCDITSLFSFYIASRHITCSIVLFTLSHGQWCSKECLLHKQRVCVTSLSWSLAALKAKVDGLPFEISTVVVPCSSFILRRVDCRRTIYMVHLFLCNAQTWWRVL